MNSAEVWLIQNARELTSSMKLLPKLYYCTNLTFPQMQSAERMQSWQSYVCGHLSYPSPWRGVGGECEQPQVPPMSHIHQRAQHLLGISVQLSIQKRLANPSGPKHSSSVPGMGLREHHRMSLRVLHWASCWLKRQSAACETHSWPLTRTSFLICLVENIHCTCLIWLNEETNRWKNNKEHTEPRRTNAMITTNTVTLLHQDIINWKEPITNLSQSQTSQGLAKSRPWERSVFCPLLSQSLSHSTELYQTRH